MMTTVFVFADNDVVGCVESLFKSCCQDMGWPIEHHNGGNGCGGGWCCRRTRMTSRKGLLDACLTVCLSVFLFFLFVAVLLMFAVFRSIEMVRKANGMWIMTLASFWYHPQHPSKYSDDTTYLSHPPHTHRHIFFFIGTKPLEWDTYTQGYHQSGRDDDPHLAQAVTSTTTMYERIMI